jgi:hypothetical protein
MLIAFCPAGLVRPLTVLASRVTMVTMDRQLRPARAPRTRVVTAPSLNELRGPVSGVIELPRRLFWQPDRHVDLDDPALLAWTYETVLREAVSVEELRTWLDGPTLVRLWPELYLPRWVRQAWQARHPELADHAPASKSGPRLSA